MDSKNEKIFQIRKPKIVFIESQIISNLDQNSNQP